MLKKTIYILLICSSLFTSCENNKSVNSISNENTDTNIVSITPVNFLDFKYSKVIAFATVLEFDYYELFYEKSIDLSKFHDTINKTLDSKQIQYLNDILSGRHRKSYRKDSISIVIDCDSFYPRHNIVFLDKNGVVVHYISICFECGRVKQSKLALFHLDDMKHFFDSIGLRVYENPKFHSRFYDSINKRKKH